MNATACAGLLASLVALPLTGLAQQTGTSTPIADAIATEAGRLASSAPPTAADSQAAWTKVRRLPSGREVRVLSKGAAPADGYFVSATDTEMIVLNTIALPPAAADIVRKLASTRADYFAAAQQGAIVTDKNLRIGSDGVFLDGQKIADLQQLLESFPRSEIVELRARPPHSAARDARFGFLAGAAICGSTSAILCETSGGGCGADALLATGVCGAVNAAIAAAVGALTYPLGRPKDVIYRAP